MKFSAFFIIGLSLCVLAQPDPPPDPPDQPNATENATDTDTVNATETDTVNATDTLDTDNATDTNDADNVTDTTDTAENATDTDPVNATDTLDTDNATDTTDADNVTDTRDSAENATDTDTVNATETDTVNATDTLDTDNVTDTTDADNATATEDADNATDTDKKNPTDTAGATDTDATDNATDTKNMRKGSTNDTDTENNDTDTSFPPFDKEEFDNSDLGKTVNEEFKDCQPNPENNYDNSSTLEFPYDFPYGGKYEGVAGAKDFYAKQKATLEAKDTEMKVISADPRTGTAVISCKIPEGVFKGPSEQNFTDFETLHYLNFNPETKKILSHGIQVVDPQSVREWSTTPAQKLLRNLQEQQYTDPEDDLMDEMADDITLVIDVDEDSVIDGKTKWKGKDDVSEVVEKCRFDIAGPLFQTNGNRNMKDAFKKMQQFKEQGDKKKKKKKKKKKYGRYDDDEDDTDEEETNDRGDDDDDDVMDAVKSFVAGLVHPSSSGNIDTKTIYADDNWVWLETKVGKFQLPNGKSVEDFTILKRVEFDDEGLMKFQHISFSRGFEPWEMMTVCHDPNADLPEGEPETDTDEEETDDDDDRNYRSGKKEEDPYKREMARQARMKKLRDAEESGLDAYEREKERQKMEEALKNLKEEREKRKQRSESRPSQKDRDSYGGEEETEEDETDDDEDSSRRSRRPIDRSERWFTEDRQPGSQLDRSNRWFTDDRRN